MKNTLYGDGIHDDYPALQEMINSGKCEVSLPVPEKCYLISKTLELPSNFRLVLPRFAEIKLADGSNCPMLKNITVSDYAERLPVFSPNVNDICRHLWYHVNAYSPDFVAENIEVTGGIWNFNNMGQLPNPEQTKVFEPYGFSGDGMLFYNVKGLKLSSMTFKDPTHYGACFDRVSYFTIENIVFDYNLGNPWAINMDGVHFNGNCHFGVIRNLKGACYDDLVALNAHEGSRGPITNIEIDGIFAETCHSAVRILTVYNNIENIHISNVYGTYYTYCIGITKFYPEERTGMFDAITIEGIYAAKASRDAVCPSPNAYVFPLIYIQNGTYSKNITIRDLHRQERCLPAETVFICNGAVVENLVIDTAVTENFTDKAMPFLSNNGIISNLSMKNVRTNGDAEIVGDGKIDVIHN